jgi:hypothetical protein
MNMLKVVDWTSIQAIARSSMHTVELTPSAAVVVAA